MKQAVLSVNSFCFIMTVTSTLIGLTENNMEAMCHTGVVSVFIVYMLYHAVNIKFKLFTSLAA